MRNHPWIPCPSMISSPIHQDLDLEELGGEITWVPPPVVTDNIVPWPWNIMGAWSPVFVHERSPIIFWLLGGVEVIFLILLTIPTKMDPFKMMSFALLFFNQKNLFLLMQNRMSFWRFITKKSRVFFPKATGWFCVQMERFEQTKHWRSSSCYQMNQPLEYSRG